jgi:hypothetical protein
MSLAEIESGGLVGLMISELAEKGNEVSGYLVGQAA